MGTYDQLRRKVFASIPHHRYELKEMRPPEFQKMVAQNPMVFGVPSYFTQHSGAIFVWPRKVDGVAIEWKRA